MPKQKILTDQRDLTDEFFEYLSKRKGWIDGVVICGGEPTIHNDLGDFCAKVKAMGFAVKLDTNGTNPELIRRLVDAKLVDYIAMDIKAPPARLAEIVGSSNALNKVNESIELIKSLGIDYEFRTTVTPDLTINDLGIMANMLRGAKRYILQQYRKPQNAEREPEPHKIETIEAMCELANTCVPTIIR